jgi:TP901 family phage tail tape measure protein
LRGASSNVDQLGNKLSKSGGILGNVAGVAAGAAAVGLAAVAAAAVAVGAGMAAAVTTAADFEQQMSAIKAVSGATGEEFSALRDLALQLGKDTAFSASEAAAGIEELVKGGVSIKDILGGAATASLTLAAAGGVKLAEAANIAAVAINAFGLKGGDMAHVADIIAGAANASTISVNDFRLSLSQAAASAALNGISFEDTATAIALLGKQGVIASDAGTSLKQFFAGLTPNSKPAITAMKKLGIITEDGKNQFFDAAGNMKDLASISGILQRATANLTKEQRAQALETIFGSDAIRAAAILASAGAGGFKDLAAEMTKTKAADVAATRLDNLKGSLEQLRGSWETLLIIAGDKFLPIIRKIVDGLTSFINKMIDSGQAAAFFSTAADALDTFIGALTGNWAGDAASGINPIVLAFGQLGQFIRNQIVPAVMALANVFKLAFSGDTQGAISAFFGLIGGQQTRLVTTLLAWGQAFVNWISPFIPPLLAKLKTLVDAIVAWIAKEGPPFVERFITDWAPSFVSWLSDLGVKALPHLTAFLDSVKAWVKENGAPMLEAFIAEWGPQFVDWLVDAGKKIIPALFKFQFAIAKWVTEEGIPGLIQIGLDLGGALISGILQALSTLDAQMREALKQATGGILGGGQNPFAPTVPGVNPALPMPPTTERPPVTAPTVDAATQAQMIALKTELLGVTEAIRAHKLNVIALNQTMAQTAPAFKNAASQLIGPY